MKPLNLTLLALLVGLVSAPALANGKGNTECPVGLVSGRRDGGDAPPERARGPRRGPRS